MLLKLGEVIILVTLMSTATQGEKGKYHLVRTEEKDGKTLVNKKKLPERDSTDKKIELKTTEGKDYLGDDEEIMGGKIAEDHEFPWMVRLERGCAGGGGTCGGALISPRLVLTAFHCTRYRPISFDKPCDHSDEKRVAVLGNPDMRDISTRVEIPVIKVYYPPRAGLRDEMKNTRDHDFAMVLLKRKVTFSKFIKPICLPEQGQKFSGEEVIAAGWGIFKKNSKVRLEDLSPVLRKVTLRVSSKKYYHNKMFGTELHKNWNGEYMDPCKGDSGGPLMKMLRNKAIIIGTVAGAGYNCHKNKVSKFEGSENGLWNQVSVWVNWIRGIMQDLNEEENKECTVNSHTEEAIEPDYNCPEKNKNYGRGRGLERKRNVKSWEACSALCSKRSDCKYWTWHHDRAGQYSHICKTMTTLQYEREDRNSVSGTRACRPDIQGSNCIEANIDYLGNDIKRLNSQSALDCACKCREHAGCRFFSWVESKQYCWLKTSDRGRTQKSGVHAGSVDCCKVGRDDFQKF